MRVCPSRRGRHVQAVGDQYRGERDLLLDVVDGEPVDFEHGPTSRQLETDILAGVRTERLQTGYVEIMRDGQLRLPAMKYRLRSFLGLICHCKLSAAVTGHEASILTLTSRLHRVS